MTDIPTPEEKHCPMCQHQMELIDQTEEPAYWHCPCGFKEYAMTGQEYRERFGED